MPRIHRLQHVERFLAAAFADDDPVGAHAQRVLQEIAHRDLAGAFEIGGAGFQADDMRLLQLQLGGILDRHGALGMLDHARQRVEERCLARSGAARDQDIAPRFDDRFEHLRDRARHAAVRNQSLHIDRHPRELADREQGPVDRKRRVTQITEVVGIEGDVITTQDLFVFQYRGERADGGLRGSFQPSGIRPAFLPRAEYFGLDRALLEIM